MSLSLSGPGRVTAGVSGVGRVRGGDKDRRGVEKEDGRWVGKKEENCVGKKERRIHTVVNCHSAHLATRGITHDGDIDERSVLVFEVQLWGPVV